MAGPKYQTVPQRDSLDQPSYSQAPPSYQNEDPTQAALLSGVPRGEDDNLPDDFKFGGVVGEATLDIRMAFIRKVYAILTVQLLVTAAFSGLSMASESYKNWIQANNWMVVLSLVGGLGFFCLTWWKRKSYPTNLLFLSGFTALEAYAISVIVSFTDNRIVLEAVILTFGIFVALSLFACQTKYDFTSWMPYLFGALWVLILVGFMAMFFPYNNKVELGYSIIAALVFSCYILVDTQLIIRHFHVEEEIAASLMLYLDIVNLFLAILRLLNATNNNN
ncbi:transmembrane BAX inhibitor motif-containing protein-like protein 4 [Sporormia fimetaria CBS 119925]|uniref:Transmembrane BAX inhibitor motif-containing protein-like protein 4 n=1 Tax=Sporormia fimetaria CBS 119925 TaxID=1340428 RepID=A0A6A6V0N7_9PLEO|nr:transmembrane BAX inhibitor motif-containing protein-like protein 4 [Sporormia fimetaria CBS 119925]